MENVEISKLSLMKKSKWERLKRKYPLYSIDMESAVVKDLDEEGLVLVEKNRLNMVINGRQNDKNGV